MSIPAGFRPLQQFGDFVAGVGPLYLKHEGPLVQLGFRVEPRHCNTVGSSRVDLQACKLEYSIVSPK